MEPIEENLKQALNRVDPPDGFVARVMARVETQSPVVSKSFNRPDSPWLAWWKYLTAHPVPAGAMIFILLVALGVGYLRRPALAPRSEHERMEGERARAQMVLALKITGSKLLQMQELLSHPPNGRVSGGNRD
jgi:hypothetical protein